SRGDGEKGPEAAQYGGAEADLAVADDDRFHVIDGFRGYERTTHEMQHGAGEYPAHDRDQRPMPPDQARGGIDQPGALADIGESGEELGEEPDGLPEYHARQ